MSKIVEYVDLYLDTLKGKLSLATDADGKIIDGGEKAPALGPDDNYMTDAEKTKLTGVEEGAEVNNISDINATDLTDGGDTSLHKHDDRYSLIAIKDKITFGIDGGGGVISTGIKNDFRVPYDCTITGWTLISNDGTTGSIQVDIWKDTYANFPPIDADSICGGHEPLIPSSTINQDLDVSDWSGETLTEGDILRFNVDSVTSLKSITLFLHIVRR